MLTYISTRHPMDYDAARRMGQLWVNSRSEICGIRTREPLEHWLAHRASLARIDARDDGSLWWWGTSEPVKLTDGRHLVIDPALVALWRTYDAHDEARTVAIVRYCRWRGGSVAETVHALVWEGQRTPDGERIDEAQVRRILAEGVAHHGA